MSCCQNCGITKGKLYKEDFPYGLVFCGLECQQELIGSGEILDFARQRGPQLTWQLFLRRGLGTEDIQATTKQVVDHIAKEFFEIPTLQNLQTAKMLLKWIIENEDNIPKEYNNKNLFLLPFLKEAINIDSVEMTQFIIGIGNFNETIYDFVYKTSNLQKVGILSWLFYLKKVDPSVDYNHAIRYASRNGHLEVVKLLLQDKRVDPSAGDNYAIRKASENGHLEVVKLLLQDEKVDPSAGNNEAIRYASTHNHPEVVKLLLQDKRVDPSAEYNYAIIRASQEGHHEVVKLLLQDERVDPSADNNFAIRFASRNGFPDVVKLLLQDKRVDPSAEYNHAIRAASDYDHLEVVKLLLQDKRVDPSAGKNSAIRYASEKGHLEVVKLLLNHPRVQKTLTEDIVNQIKQKFQDDPEIQELLEKVRPSGGETSTKFRRVFEKIKI